MEDLVNIMEEQWLILSLAKETENSYQGL